MIMIRSDAPAEEKAKFMGLTGVWCYCVICGRTMPVTTKFEVCSVCEKEDQEDD